ncbi:DUF3417 domain-containing protein [Rhodothermus marinus]|uniref:DUF3417 domain-containing protein n=1 Tax=Rhodothermus marinus TaxID=29549 RepID=UPI000ABA4A9F|nr:DUF3417 domain-containing protein [Rhodothermus marinus]
MLNDRPFQKEVDRIYEAFQAYLNSPPRLEDAPRTVYFCMEYGLHESLPFYAGGLGVLAGDHIKAASDLGIPMTAVGLFLREGYFRQRFDHSGWQLADYPAMDPLDHPMSLVHGPDGYPLVITVHLAVSHFTCEPGSWKSAACRCTCSMRRSTPTPSRCAS